MKIDAASGTSLSRLRHLRQQIARKESEVGGVILQARKGSDRRVEAKGGRCNAENELEQALLDLTVLKQRIRATADSSSEARPLLQDNINTKRLDLLAASPPFVLSLEQAVVNVANVDEVAGTQLFAKQTRWKSTLKRLMKDVSESIDRSKKLSGRGNLSKAVDDELTLVAASARRLSLHVNAWTTREISRELERIWLQAVRAEAGVDPQFHQVVNEWEKACKALESFSSAEEKESIVRTEKQDAVETRICDCLIRAGIRPKAEKTGWWTKRQVRFLAEELKHIESKVAPMALPSALAARYNLLLAKCAEAGAWATAVSAYRSSRVQGITKPSKVRHRAGGPFSSEPFVYQHLLRAAKNANPPLPHAAMLVLREMRLRGDEPTITHYNLVVSACARAAAVGASVVPLLPLDNGKNANECSVGFVGSSEPTGGTDRERVCSIDAGSDSGSNRFEIVEREVVVPTRLDGNPERGVVEHAPSEIVTLEGQHQDDQVTDREHGCSLSAGWRAMESRGVEATGEAWRLALDVIAYMRNRGLAPTEVTLNTLVECCRCAATVPSPSVARGGEMNTGSTPAEIYTAMKEAGIPIRFSYRASRENALKGGRRFPEYVAVYR